MSGHVNGETRTVIVFLTGFNRDSDIAIMEEELTAKMGVNVVVLDGKFKDEIVQL